ncbi:MAG: ubiquitin-activating E1 FCCH domain-containing protein, partial [bacterium]|nr:ubiquitin-activating E1 FCCH domain-containing protein [bacterium]
EAFRADISAISNADPCAVTTLVAHGYATDDFVRLTDLNSCIPIWRGCDQINNKRFKVIVTSETEFTLRNPITFEDIDSTNFTPYVTGGRCNKISHEFEYNEE